MRPSPSIILCCILSFFSAHFLFAEGPSAKRKAVEFPQADLAKLEEGFQREFYQNWRSDLNERRNILVTTVYAMLAQRHMLSKDGKVLPESLTQAQTEFRDVLRTATAFFVQSGDWISIQDQDKEKLRVAFDKAETALFRAGYYLTQLYGGEPEKAWFWLRLERSTYCHKQVKGKDIQGCVTQNRDSFVKELDDYFTARAITAVESSPILKQKLPDSLRDVMVPEHALKGAEYLKQRNKAKKMPATQTKIAPTK